jgi:hypothetical protein
MIALPLPLLVGPLIRETPLIMLPIEKPHDLRGLLLHLPLQHNNQPRLMSNQA